MEKKIKRRRRKRRRDVKTMHVRMDVPKKTKLKAERTNKLHVLDV